MFPASCSRLGYFMEVFVMCQDRMALMSEDNMKLEYYKHFNLVKAATIKRKNKPILLPATCRCCGTAPSL